MTVCLTCLKINKLNIKNESVENCKNLDEDFEQFHFSLTFRDTDRIGEESTRLLK